VKVKVGRHLFARSGGTVVFAGRFVTALRTYAALFAGLNETRWPRFTVFNAAGGVAWSAVCTFGAFGLGAAATGIGQAIALAGLGLSAVLTAAGIVLARRWMRRLEQRALAACPDPDREDTDPLLNERKIPRSSRFVTRTVLRPR
jgi:membrane protein DedA with SNARE-associated domain